MRKGYIILIIALILVVIAISSLIIWGILFRPKAMQTYVEPGVTQGAPICLRTPTKCRTNADCKVCGDNVELECVEVTRFTPDQKKKYGDSEKYCLKPVPPEKPCNHKLGGIWSWTGWSSIDEMEWDCLCTYPEIAGGTGCSELNPNVCGGDHSNYNYDATTSNRGPRTDDCKCPAGTNMLTPLGEGPIPLCVPDKPYLCNDKKMCESMYSNSRFVEKGG